MKRLVIALVQLAKSLVTRPAKQSKQLPGMLHWTKFNRPIDQMTEVERRLAAERLADEMLRVINDNKK